MQTISFTPNLVPLIEELSQNLTAIASMLKADTENAVPASAAEKQHMQTEEIQSPKSKSSPQKKSEAEPTPAASAQDSLAGSSEESKPVFTIEQVRAVLAEKSQAGLTAQVKDLLTSFGSVKLSGIDPARYSELIEAAKALQ